MAPGHIPAGSALQDVAQLQLQGSPMMKVVLTLCASFAVLILADTGIDSTGKADSCVEICGPHFCFWKFSKFILLLNR